MSEKIAPGGEYVVRMADEQLWKAAREWLFASAESCRWISVRSAPGRGNTALLRHFEQKVAHDTYGLAECGMLFISGRSDDSTGPPPLTPLAMAIFRKLRQLRFSRLSSWVSKMSLVPRRRIAAMVLTYALSVVLLLGVIAFAQYGSQGFHIRDTVWWHEFVVSYLPNHETDIPLWFFLSIVLSSILTFVCGLHSRLLRPVVDPVLHPSPQEVAEFKLSDEAFLAHLGHLCVEKKGLVLVVDDATDLPWKDRALLAVAFSSQLSQFPCISPINKLLIVTLDLESKNWNIPADLVSQYKEVPVCGFDNLLEVQAIAHGLAGNSRQEFSQELLCEAQRDLRILLRPAMLRFSALVSDAYQKTREDEIPGSFGLPQLMAYWSVSRRQPIAKKALKAWLSSLASGGLKDCLELTGLIPPEGPGNLAKEFAKCALVRQVGDVLYDEASHSNALASWLKEGDPKTLAAMHLLCYWELWHSHNNTSSSAQPAQQVPRADQCRRAAWHLSRLRRLRPHPNEVLDPCARTDKLPQLQCDAVDCLLQAATSWRASGDIAEADAAAMDAVVWIQGMNPEARWPHLERAVGLLWDNYWLFGVRETRDHLREVVQTFAEVANLSEWRLNLLYEMLLRGELAPEPIANELDASHAKNKHRLAKFLWQVKLRFGFLEDALAEGSLAPPEPVAENRCSIWESRLWQIRALAFAHRGEAENAQTSLGKWHSRLEEASETNDFLTLVWTTFQRGCYWHTEAEVAACLMNKKEEPANERTAESISASSVAGPVVAPDDTAERIERDPFHSAAAEYKRALGAAVIAGYPALILMASFDYAILLARYTPRAERTDDPPWWHGWDKLFTTCARLESEQGWKSLAPAIHRARFEFFEHLDTAASLGDLMRTYSAIKEANYPGPVLLTWHQKAAALLNNFGVSPEHKMCAATLHEDWAHELAFLPEAANLRAFPLCVEHEKAEALGYAAQNWRGAADLERAEAALSAAEEFMGKSPGPVSGEKTERVRDLSIHLRLQRAWLLREMGHKDEHERRIADLWADMLRTDQCATLVLQALVGIEEACGILSDPWPAGRKTDRLKDPKSIAMSLHETWPEDSIAPSIRNRFQFRFCQLLALGWPDGKPLSAEIIPEALPRLLHYQRFGELVLQFGQIEASRKLLGKLQEILVGFVLLAYLYFRSVQPSDQEELRALKILMKFEPNETMYRREYIRVLAEFEDLFERELEVRQATGAVDWLRTAERLRDHFGMLVDPDLHSRLLAAEVSRTGLKPERFVKELVERKTAVDLARRLLEQGQHGVALEKVKTLLPAPNIKWVEYCDLEALDIWLRAWNALDRPVTDEYSTLSARLRGLVLQFVKQYALTIPEPEIQQIALGLLKSLANVRELQSSGAPPKPAPRRAGLGARTAPGF